MRDAKNNGHLVGDPDGWAERRLTRRKFLRLGGASLAGASFLGVGGCGGGQQGSGSNVTLRWAMWSDTPAETKAWRERAQAVTKAHPNIKVKLETTSFQNYFDKLSTEVASGTSPDIISMQQMRMPEFAARGVLRSLEDFIKSDKSFDFNDYFSLIEKGLSFNGKVYALAYDLGPAILYYNKDLFNKAGVSTPPPTKPMSWEKFREVAGKLTNRGAKQYGYVTAPYFDQLVPWLWSGGGGYMNSDETKCTLGSPQSIAALQFVVDLLAKDRVAAPITDLSNPNSGYEQFSSGQIGMYADGPWQIVNIKQNAKFNFGLAPFPAGRAGSITYVAGSGFGISKATSHPKEAWEAIKVITSRQGEEYLAKIGRAYPSRKSAVSTFENANASVSNVGLVQEVLTGKVAKALPYVTTANWEQVNNMLQQNLIPILLGQESVRKAVATTVPKFNQLLKQARHLVKQGS